MSTTPDPTELEVTGAASDSAGAATASPGRSTAGMSQEKQPSESRVVVQKPRPAWWLIIGVAVLGLACLIALFCHVPDLVLDEAGGDQVRAARTTGVATLRAAVLAGGLGLAAVLTLMFNARTAHTAEQNLHLTRQAQDDARDQAEQQARVAQENIELTRRAQDDARAEAEDREKATQESLRLTRQAQVAERYSAAVELLSGGTNSSDSSSGGGDDTARTTAELGGIYALEQLAREGREYRAIVVEVLSAFVRGRAALQPDEKVGWRYYGPDRESVAPEVKEPTNRVHGPATLAAITVLARIAPLTLAATMEHVRALGSIGGVERQHLIRADLRGTNLRYVNLTSGAGQQPDLSLADFDGADLTRARLYRTKLRRASFIGVDLTEANLDSADLRDATLIHTWLHGTRLVNADLTGANLAATHGLTQDQIEAARGNDKTLLPDRLRRPESWSSADD